MTDHRHIDVADCRPKDRPKWAARLRLWALEDSPEWFPFQAVLCILCWCFGHYPEMDQCGKPEHDYCALCIKSMPGQAWYRAVQSAAGDGDDVSVC